MKFNYTQNNFTSGEFSRELDGRVEIKEYANASHTLFNMLNMPRGGIKRRPGTKLTKLLTVPHGEIIHAYPFVHTTNNKNNNDRYIIYMNADPANSDAEALRVMLIDSDDEDETECTINIKGMVTNELRTFISFLSYFTRKLQYVQYGDTIIFVDPLGYIEPFGLARVSQQVFNVFYFRARYNEIYADATEAQPLPFLTMPMCDRNIDGALKIAATTPAVESGESLKTVFLAPTGFSFATTDVGCFIELEIGGKVGLYYTFSLDNIHPTSGYMRAYLVLDVDSTAATDNFAWGAWSNKFGWPRSIGFFEGRLIFGGNEKFPDTLWASYANNIYLMRQRRFPSGMSTALDALKIYYYGNQAEVDAYSLVLGGKDNQTITWISGLRNLHIGTMSSEFVATGGADRILSALAVSMQQSTAEGGAGISPVTLSDQIFFVDRSYRRVKRLSYDSDKSAWIPADLSVYRDMPSIYAMAWQRSEQLLWVLDADETSGLSNGKLTAICLSPYLGVVAHSQHEIAGTYDDKTHAIVYDIASLPSADYSRDLLFLITGRYKTVEGVTTTEICLECLDPKSTVYKDNNVFTGPVNKNLSFEAYWESLRIEAGAQYGSSVGEVKRIDRIGVLLSKTTDFYYGKTFSTATFSGKGTEADSEIVNLAFPPGSDTSAYVCIKACADKPLTVLSLTARGVTNEG